METMNTGAIMHPGFYIKEEMEARGWIQRDLAFILGCNEQALNAILSGKRGISADMAKALGEAFDVPAQFFANLQQAHDLSQARTPDPSVAVRRNMQTSYPVREMIRRGWLAQSDAAMLEAQLVRFFDVSGADQIPYLEHAAKKSRYEEREIAPQQLAWLFRVKQLAKSISVPRYSETALRRALKDLESLLISPEEARQAPRILMECGVRFIVSEKLPSAKIDGVCFWLDQQSPVIGMSMQRDQIDNFWFVLRHEIEHVLRRDGQGEEIIDESLVGEKASSTAPEISEQERLANAAAADFCAPSDKLDSFMIRKKPFFYEKDVAAFAQIHRRHIGLVVGQMQRRMDRYDYLKRHLVKIRHIVIPGAIADGWGQVLPVSL